MRVRRQPIFRQHDRRSAKAVRLDDVRPGFEIFPVNVQNHIGPRPHQILVAAFERRPAKILRRQMPLLQHRPHRSIEHKNALREQLSQSLRRFIQVTHERKAGHSLSDFLFIWGHQQRRPRLGYASILRSFAAGIERLAAN